MGIATEVGMALKANKHFFLLLFPFHQILSFW